MTDSSGDRTARGMERPSRPRLSERETRAPSSPWDRLKFIILFVGLWFATLAVVWTDLRPLDPPTRDIWITALQDYAWLLLLATFEAIRQLNYLLQEHSKGYYGWWNSSTARYHKRVGRMNDFTRYRVGRALKLLLFLLLLSSFLGRLFDTDPVWLGIVEAPAALVSGLPLLMRLAFAFFFVIFQFVGLFWFLSRGGMETYGPDDIDTRFTDVKGQDAVLDRIKETMIFLEDPESIEEKGGYVPGGVLLWGPPGTGKTLMAQAVAGETAKPFVFVEPGAFVQMFMGVGVLKVKGLYRKLRRLALRYGAVIVFFDEADALGSRGQTSQGFTGATGPWTSTPMCNGINYLSSPTRDSLLLDALPRSTPFDRPGFIDRFIMGGGMGGGGMGTLQALLTEMSGLEKSRGLINRIRRMLGIKQSPPPKYRILHMFATNMPGALDEAMLRPGRIDRQYKVGFPTKDGRKSTFEYYLARVSHELTDDDVEKLATITPYATGASIKDTVNEALVVAIRDGRDMVTYQDVIRAKQIKQLGVPDDFEYIERERHATAVHEACHAVVAFKLRHHAVIDIATIERRGDVGGLVSWIPTEDQMFSWRSEREVDIMASLASLAGERMFFDGDNSVGVGGDLQNATRMAMVDVGLVGMGDTIASRGVTLAQLRGSQSLETGSDRAILDGPFGHQIEAKLRDLYDRTWAILEENRAEVLAVAHVLETHKTVTGEDVAAVIDGTVGPRVDGRPYADPGFRQMLENYHTAVVRAHKDHGGVEAVIPVPVPPPPVEVSPASRDEQPEERRLNPANQELPDAP